MKALIPFSLLLLTSSAFALEKEISGNIEVQGRHSWNNEQGKEDLLQNWSEENFGLAYGNLNSKFEHEGIRIEANLFARHSRSPLYNPAPDPVRGDGPYAATAIYSFPGQLVARDVLKLQHEDQRADYKNELVLNKLFLEWNYDEHRVTLGRMYINYGLGEMFNPINPFNQPTGLTAIQQVAQGNDGGAIAFFLSDKYTVEFYLLGDKRVENYEGQIEHTYWVHGEFQATDKLQLDYVAGQDQKRQKLGGQAAYRFEEAMVFSQLLFQSHYVDRDPSTNLWDFMLGYDQQITALWHVRGETGYQKRNRFADLTSFDDRFLPTEYFIALANIYEVHPLLKLSGTLVNDIKSGFTYLIAKSTYSVSSNIEAELFSNIPAAKGDSTDQPAQKLVTTDVGMALRAFF